MRTDAADPFDAAREEVARAVSHVERLHSQWRQRRQDNGTFSMSSALAAATADLRALAKAAAAAEKHAGRLGLSAEEVSSRKDFVTQQQCLLARIQKDVDDMHRSATPDFEDFEQRRSGFLSNSEDERKHEMIRQQDEHLDELSMAASRLHQTAVTINEEIENHQRMLCDLDEQLERQSAQMNFVMRRLAKVLKTSDWRQLCTVIWLVLVAVLLALLVIIT